MDSTSKKTEVLATLAEGIASLTSSEAWVQWLDAQRRFHRYSFGNTLLIALQRPDATQVAGFHTWLRLGRHVRKGEKGIAILAPVVRRFKVTDEATGEENVVMGAPSAFRVTYVFDLAQTDGEELPTAPVNKLQGDDPDDRYSALIEVAHSLGFTVEEDYLDAGVNGFCNHEKRLIRVEVRNDPRQQVKTLAHELGHAILHAARDLPRERMELEAEFGGLHRLRRFGHRHRGLLLRVRGHLGGWRRRGAQGAHRVRAADPEGRPAHPRRPVREHRGDRGMTAIPLARPVQLTLDLRSSSARCRCEPKPYWDYVDNADLGGELRVRRAGIQALLTAEMSVHHPAWDWRNHCPDDYFAFIQVSEVWVPPHPVTFWRRPLTMITEPIANAGFVIERMVEARPDPVLEERDPEAYRELSRSPFFLHLKIRPRAWTSDVLNGGDRTGRGPSLRPIIDA